MLDFNILLRTQGIDPAEVLLIRHVPREQKLRRIFPWIAAERPDLFLAWQRIQWEPLQTAMTRAKYVAAFIGQEAGRATFVEVNRIVAWRQLDDEGYRTFRENQELIGLGMLGREPAGPTSLAFDLDPVADGFSDYRGRLVINWPKPDRSWWRWAGNGIFPIRNILEESLFQEHMPAWDELVLSWDELRSMPRDWQASLSNWRGVYYIFDVERRAGYVGAAYGDDNLLGRWRAYATNGHGGNKQLRLSDPQNLRFSILQRTSPDLPATDVCELETKWKARLQTRNHGLNEN